jgi:hypothetical protein
VSQLDSIAPTAGIEPISQVATTAARSDVYRWLVWLPDRDPGLGLEALARPFVLSPNYFRRLARHQT